MHSHLPSTPTVSGALRNDPAQAVPDLVPRIDSRRLLAGARELLISHAGQEYRLRLTRNDKLILTK